MGRLDAGMAERRQAFPAPLIGRNEQHLAGIAGRHAWRLWDRRAPTIARLRQATKSIAALKYRTFGRLTCSGQTRETAARIETRAGIVEKDVICEFQGDEGRRSPSAGAARGSRAAAVS